MPNPQTQTLVAAGLSLLQGVVILLLQGGDGVWIELMENVLIYPAGDDTGMQATLRQEVTGDINLVIPIVAFFVLDGIFFLLAGIHGVQDYEARLRENFLPIRMIQFTFSSTASSIVIALTMSLRSRCALVAIGGLNIVTMLCGLLAEGLHAYLPLVKGARFSTLGNQRTLPDPKDTLVGKLIWAAPVLAHVVGWIAHAVQWLLMFLPFFDSVSSSPVPPPRFVYAIVFGMAGVHAWFGIEQILVLTNISSRRRLETISLFVMVVCKSFLGWMLYGYVLSPATN